MPAAPPLACLSSWPGTASLEGMAIDVPGSQDRDSVCPAVHQTAPGVPSVPWRGGGDRVLFGVRVCGHLLLGLGTRTSVSHPGRESATDSREVKLGWLGLRMGSVHDAPWSSVSPTPASACARGQAGSSALGVSVLVLLARGQGLDGTQGRGAPSWCPGLGPQPHESSQLHARSTAAWRGTGTLTPLSSSRPAPPPVLSRWPPHTCPHSGHRSEVCGAGGIRPGSWVELEVGTDGRTL